MSDLNVVSNGWMIGLLDYGKFNDAILPCCCPVVGMAKARSNLDQSDCCFNVLCVNPLVSMWIIKSAYGIPQDPCSDYISLLCCYCCVANQVYQTTLNRKNPSIDGGFAYNKIQLHQCGGPPCHVCNAMCCTSCTVAEALHRYIGMPWWLGCCCVSSTAAINILSFHYRLADTGCSCCYYKACQSCALGTVVFHADSVGKTSDRYLVRAMTSNINPAGVMEYGLVEQQGPVAGQVLQQPQYDPAVANPVPAQTSLATTPVTGIKSKPQPTIALSTSSRYQVTPLTTATLISSG